MLCLWAIWATHGAFPCVAQIRYFQPAAVQGKAIAVKSIHSAVRDSIASDTIFQVFSTDGYPLHYYKKITTSVCFDNKCRLLKCTLYWNITGRYLGFGLEKGEYLSKARHKPFKKAEYVRLNAILADPSSPLSSLSYGELAPRPKPANGKPEVDAVTSATARYILDDVVPGAAYTTYKMWHVVYGPSQDEVQKLTEQLLSPDLILKILDSPDPGDKTWALNHIRGYVGPTPRLRERLFALIGNGRYNLAERVIHALDTTELRSDTVQTMLVGKLAEGSYSIKKLIIAKLAEAPTLAPQTITGLTPILNGTNPELTSNILDLFALHHVADPEINRDAASLLSKENAFVARKAYKYLSTLSIDDQQIKDQIKAYENNQPRE